MTRAGLTAALLGSALCCAISMAPADSKQACAGREHDVLA
jgi:hypothetical protein